ncbi:MAG: hypothetical protein K6T86_19935 [Pirellulales bacterium]|nr:hypothetical protein [Pirellulales bacterium]
MTQPEREHPRQYSEPSWGAAPDGRERLLEMVLKETRAALGDNGSKPACLEGLRAVALRHAGRPFCLDPVTIALVEAVLADGYQRLFARPEGWQQMVADVARTLYEDAPAHERLARLWAQLGGESP